MCCPYSSLFLTKAELEVVVLFVHRPPFKVSRQKAFLMKKVKPCSEKVLRLLVKPVICIMKDVLLRALWVMGLMVESSSNVLS